MCLIFHWTSVSPSPFQCFDTSRPRQGGSHFQDDIFKCIFLNKYKWILIKISLQFVPNVRINNTPELVQIVAWHQPDDKPLSDPMIIRLPVHLCVTWPQCVNNPITHGDQDKMADILVIISKLNFWYANCWTVMQFSVEFVYPMGSLKYSCID